MWRTLDKTFECCVYIVELLDTQLNHVEREEGNKDEFVPVIDETKIVSDLGRCDSSPAGYKRIKKISFIN